MLTQAQNERISRVGPETPTGEFPENMLSYEEAPAYAETQGRTPDDVTSAFG